MKCLDNELVLSGSSRVMILGGHNENKIIANLW